jgi:hypothetical protein
MKQSILFWTIQILIAITELLVYNNLYGFDNRKNSFTSNPTFKIDSISSTVLKEISIYSNPRDNYNSEKPRLKRNYHVEMPPPFEIGLLVNDKQLVGKKLENISIHFDRKLEDGYKFQVFIYSIGSDGNPKTLINNKVLVYSKNQANWNEYYLDHENIEIPESGLAMIIHFFEKPTETKPVPKINMGLYGSQRLFYLKPLGSHGWYTLKSFKIVGY